MTQALAHVRRRLVPLAWVLAASTSAWALPPRGLAPCIALGVDRVVAADHDRSFKRLRDGLEQLAPAERAMVEDFLEAVYFIDFTHASPRALDAFTGKAAFNDPVISTIYDANRSRAWEAFSGARVWLDERLRAGAGTDWDFGVLQEIHRRTMQGNVEGLAPESLGVARSTDVYGNAETYGPPLTEAHVAEIAANAYLSFEQTLVDPQGGIRGKIHYPSLRRLNPRALDRLRSHAPALAQEIDAFVARGGAAADPSGNAQREGLDLQRRLVEGLVQERFAWFAAEKARLLAEHPGPIGERAPDFLRRYVELTAELTRDVISIHPFGNGNGRSTRLLLNGLLELEGIPRARLLDPDEDLYSPIEDWKSAVVRGIEDTRRLREDLATRLRMGLRLENSPEILTPAIPRAVYVPDRDGARPNSVDGVALVETDPGQYAAWLKLRLEADPALDQRMRTEPVATARVLEREYAEFVAAHQLRYVHPKQGPMWVQLKLVDPDFVETFGVSYAADPKLWAEKMSRWYSADQLVFRGLSRRAGQPAHTEEEVLSYFLTPNGHMASNQSARHAGRPDFLDAVRADFRTYNRELMTTGVSEQATDHSQTGPRYATSYGYSTSTAQDVAKAFGMGAMVVAPYGRHTLPEHQLKLSDRIVVGAYWADKDVSLNTLRQVEGEYRNKYARQREIMGIGASDPDSIMVVQRISAEGKVVRSWVRNPDNPVEIWVVGGEYYPKRGESPPPELLVETRRIAPPLPPRTKLTAPTPPAPERGLAGRLRRAWKWLGGDRGGK